jgi:hypothetical protein
MDNKVKNVFFDRKGSIFEFRGVIIRLPFDMLRANG